MFVLRDVSVRHKITFIVVLTSTVALLLSSAVLVAFDRSTYKRAMLAELTALGDIVGSNSSAALSFGDVAAAKEILSALGAKKQIQSARLVSADGTVLARYEGDLRGASVEPLTLDSPGVVFLEDRFVVRRDVVLHGENLGSVYLESDLRELDVRVQRYLSTAVLVLMMALLVALLISVRLQRMISMPILRLVDTAKMISRRKDYSIRATKYGGDEIGTLIDGFNDMVEQIQRRDAELDNHRLNLEQEVAQRTNEITEVNRRLHDSEARLRAIVEGTASTVGAEFFDALVTSMSRVLDMRWVLVSSLRGESEAVVLAMWDGESVQSGFTYELEGTPCKVARDVDVCVVADGAAAQYPSDELFQEYQVRSYIGVVLKDRRGVPLGILSAFDQTPLRNRRSAESLLRIFGARAAVELERMYVEAELFNSEEKTRAILESAADAIVTVNADGNIGTFNQAAENIFGFSVAEIEGNKIDVLVAAPHDAELAAELCGQTAKVDRHFVGRRREILGVRKSGSTFPMSMAMSEVQLSGQKVFTAVIRDITGEKELEEMKSNIISSVSHEIRTPLTAILSSAKIIKRSGGEKPEITGKFAGIIVDEGERLTRLINDLLDFSKLDAGAIELSLEEIDPLEVVGRAVALSKAEAHEQGVLLGVESAEGVPLIRADTDKIMQVLTNLVNNAIKFTSQGGKVSVAVERGDDEFVRISVIDTGVGIAQADQGHIFERFKQLGSVLTDSPKGTGLGLAICKEIVNALGGKIWVESKFGEGSAFRFTVPIASSPTARREIRREQSASKETEQPATSGLFPFEQG